MRLYKADIGITREMFMELIKTVDVTRNYLDENKSPRTLKNINLSIESGSFIAITGSPGSDRTVLLRLLCGIDKPDNGKLFFCGIDVKK
jgi:ABC-type lipoprotein export system ATPase subunit